MALPAAGLSGSQDSAYRTEPVLRGEIRTAISATGTLAAGCSVATGLFFGFYPARKASQLVPIEALRHQG